MGGQSAALRGMLEQNDRRNALLRFLHLFIIDLLIVIAAYSLFRRPMFSADSYQTVNDPSLLITPPLWGGRVSVSLFHRLEQLAGFHPVLNQLPGKLMLIIAFALSPAVLTCRAYSLLPERSALRLIGLNAVFLAAYVNPFLGEWFHFSESALYMGAGYLLTLAAVLIGVSRKGLLWRIGEFLCLMLAVNLYQVFFEYYVLFMILFLVLRSQMRWNKGLLPQTLRVLAFGLACCVIHLLITKACNAAMGVSDYRSGSVTPQAVLENAGSILRDLDYVLLQTYHVMPEYLFAAALLLLGGSVGAALVRLKRPAMLVYTLAAMAGCLVLPFSIHLISGDYQLERAMRTMTALFALPALPGAWLCALPDKGKLSRLRTKAVAILTSAFLLLSAYSTQQYSVDLNNKVTLDRQRAIEVLDRIEDYERHSGVKVARVAAVLDDNPSYYVEYMKFSQGGEDPFRPAFVNDYWDIFVILNYYGGELEWAGEMPEEIEQEYFAGKDWDHFIPAEQLVFVGDTLYMAVY